MRWLRLRFSAGWCIFMRPPMNQMEASMAVLKSLTFTTLPRPGDVGSQPAGRRTRGRTEATSRRSELQTDRPHIGQERRRENRRRNAASRDTVVAHDGKWDVRVLCSPQPKDFESEKGKAGIAMASLEKLPALIDTLITAVRNDELDKQLAHAAKSGQVRKAKKAA